MHLRSIQRARVATKCWGTRCGRQSSMTTSPDQAHQPASPKSAPLLELLFANQDALVDHLRIAVHEQHRYLPAASDSQRDLALKQHALTRLLEQQLWSDPPLELQRQLLTSTPAVGTLVAIEQAFYFAHRAGDRVRLRGKVNTDAQWQVEGLVDTARFPFSSTADMLSGRRRVFLVGSVIGCQAGMIEIRPLFIGRRRWQDKADQSTDEPRRVYAQQVDHFKDVDWSLPVTPAELKTMNQMRELDVKAALAQIIGCPFVTRDWGGERSDLVTNNFMVEGQQTSAAWLLKGRSVQGTMYVSDLGKRGDQIERLSTEPVDVLVVQHNDQISSAVVNLVKAFAHDMRMPRRYMILEGDVTARILRHHNALA